MSTQSSLGTAFRAIVMLTCLLVLPAVALFGQSRVAHFASQFGTSLTELAKQVWQQQFGVSTASAASSLPEAPPFRPGLNSNPAPLSPVGAPSEPGLRLLAALANSSAASNDRTGSGVVATGYNAPAEPPTVNLAGGWSTERSSAMSPELAVSHGADPFTIIHQRLRALGMTRYTLETWGSEGKMYRFHCQTLIGGSANYTQFFEATDREPLSAMSQVLQQVEAWRAGRPR